MNIGFVTVNYNNAHHTGNFVRSIEALMAEENYLIIVMDNASSKDDWQKLAGLCAGNSRVRICPCGGNIGYFPALNLGLARLREEMAQLDAVLIGNNDLTLREGFKVQLKAHLRLLDTHAVVSPNLMSEDGEHQNPHLRGGVSRLRKVIWRLYYSSYWIGQSVLMLAKVSRRFTARRDHHAHAERGPIAQGYGACYLIGPEFFRHFRGLWAPTFLMQEEYFLYRQLQEIGQRMFYEPNIVVTHHGHASTGSVPSRKIWEISRESHLVYLAFESGRRSVREFDHLRVANSTRPFGAESLSPSTCKPSNS